MNETLFENIANQLSMQGYCVVEKALPQQLITGLRNIARSQDLAYASAGVGRGQAHMTDKQIRGDEIHWIEPESDAERRWLNFIEQLQTYLNRRLFLGLFSYESHFAHYAPGTYYEKHADAFKGQSNRILSTVTYLNDAWQEHWGGELLIYDESGENVIERIPPREGTLVIFLSESFPHEVLPATKDRYSIAGWFRVNNSNSFRADPPK